MTSMSGRVYKANTASGTAMKSAQSKDFFNILNILGALRQFGWRSNYGGLSHR